MIQYMKEYIQTSVVDPNTLYLDPDPENIFQNLGSDPVNSLNSTTLQVWIKWLKLEEEKNQFNLYTKSVEKHQRMEKVQDHKAVIFVRQSSLFLFSGSKLDAQP